MYKKIIIGIVSIAVISVAYYGISPLFKNTRIDEAAPVSKESLSVTPPVAPVQTDDSMIKENVLADTSDVMEGTDNGTPIQLPIKDESVPKIVAAPVVGTTLHPASGTARIINAESGTVIRYENFKTINGPDLFVYLAKDLDATEFVNLGELKATEGNVNYDVPANVDIDDYKYIMVWCKQFGVLFNYADLSTLR